MNAAAQQTALFERAAMPLIERGIPVIPLQPRTKVACLSNWQELATTDRTQVAAWSEQNPDANVACVAKAEPGGFWFFEIDKPGLQDEIERETGKRVPETMCVSSSPGRGHFYFRQTPASMAMGNAQGKDEDGKEAWSARVDNRYVVGPQSHHPTSGGQYEPISHAGIVEAPDWLIEWCLKHATGEAQRVNASADGPPIPRGSHDTELFRIACLLRNAGMDYKQIRDNLITICEKRCENHGPDYIDMCEKKAKSACKYAVGHADYRAKVGSTNPDQAQGRMMDFVRGDSIQPKRLKWLWRGRIVADKLNVFSGEPDVGKGMTTCDFAARLTKHWDFPDAKNELDGPKDVVFLSSEDDMEDTTVPRLIVAGADMTRIHFVQISDNSTGTVEEGIVCLDNDLPALEEMIKRHPDVVLIIPDPVIAFLGKADPNKDKDVRPIYSKMKAFAKRLNVAWLFVNHWNKNQGANSINRTSGAKTMVSAPRATWMFTRSPEDPNRFLMMKGKGNLSGNKTKTLAYRIIGVPYDFGDGLPIDPDGVGKLEWDGETEHNTEDVLKDQNDPKVRQDTKAEELLTKLLENGAVAAADVYRAGEKLHFDDNRMQRARYRLNYKSAKVGAVWYWGKSDEDILMRKQRLYTPHPVTLRSEPADVDLDGPIN